MDSGGILTKEAWGELPINAPAFTRDGLPPTQIGPPHLSLLVATDEILQARDNLEVVSISELAEQPIIQVLMVLLNLHLLCGTQEGP